MSNRKLYTMFAIVFACLFIDSCRITLMHREMKNNAQEMRDNYFDFLGKLTPKILRLNGN